MRRALAIVVIAAGAVAAGAVAAAQAGPGWELRVPERVEVAAGQGGTLPIALAIDRGRTISRDAPLIIDLAAGGGARVARQRLSLADAVDPDADAPRFAVPVSAASSGEVKVRVRFWLCAAKTCRPIDAHRTVIVAVSAPPAAPPAAPPDAGAHP